MERVLPYWVFVTGNNAIQVSPTIFNVGANRPQEICVLGIESLTAHHIRVSQNKSRLINHSVFTVISDLGFCVFPIPNRVGDTPEAACALIDVVVC